MHDSGQHREDMSKGKSKVWNNVKNHREVTMVNNELIKCLRNVERRVKCMLRFATRDVSKGVYMLCGLWCRESFRLPVGEISGLSIHSFLKVGGIFDREQIS